MIFPRTLQCFGFITLVALMYISMQMQILSLAYEGQSSENQMQQLVEDNSAITYDIMVMESANHIGSHLLAADPSLNFASEAEVVEIVATVVEEQPLAAAVQARSGSIFTRMLSMVSTDAQARTLQ